MKPDAVALGIGVLALAAAALFVQWLSEQPLDWSGVKVVGTYPGVIVGVAPSAR